ncbi:MAG: helix-turn-helix domain-containing protein [Candidatus Micrarchaeia archaeon]
MLTEKAIYGTLLLGNRWTLRIICTLLYEQEKVGFNELQRKLKGISPKTLSTRLQELEEAGIINREISDKPLCVRYSLTEAGKELKEVAEVMERWCEKWIHLEEAQSSS